MISSVVPVLQVHGQLQGGAGLIGRVGGLKQGSQRPTNRVVSCLKYPTGHAVKGWDLRPNQLLTYSPDSGCRKHLPSLSTYNPDSALELGDKIICSLNGVGFEQFFPFFFKRSWTQFFPPLFTQRASSGSWWNWVQSFSLMYISPLKIGQKK